MEWAIFYSKFTYILKDFFKGDSYLPNESLLNLGDIFNMLGVGNLITF